MLYTLQSAIDKVRRLCADPGGNEPLFSDELIVDGLNESLQAILPWVANEATTEYTGDGETFQFELPADLYEVQALHSSVSHAFIPRIGLFPGSLWFAGEGTSLDEQSFMEYPAGFVSVASPPNSSDTLTLYYTAYWPEPEEADDTLAPPTACYAAICYYAASYCLATKGQSAANIRQYNTRVDSGNPEHNPVMELSKHYLKRFDMEIGRHPQTQKGAKSG